MISLPLVRLSAIRSHLAAFLSLPASTPHRLAICCTVRQCSIREYGYARDGVRMVRQQVCCSLLDGYHRMALSNLPSGCSRRSRRSRYILTASSIVITLLPRVIVYRLGASQRPGGAGYRPYRSCYRSDSAITSSTSVSTRLRRFSAACLPRSDRASLMMASRWEIILSMTFPGRRIISPLSSTV